jgi:hypothetical protein
MEWWRERDIRGRKYIDGIRQSGWPEIEVASIDFLAEHGYDISRDGLVTEARAGESVDY